MTHREAIIVHGHEFLTFQASLGIERPTLTLRHDVRKRKQPVTEGARARARRDRRRAEGEIAGWSDRNGRGARHCCCTASNTPVATTLADATYSPGMEVNWHQGDHAQSPVFRMLHRSFFSFQNVSFYFVVYQQIRSKTSALLFVGTQ